MIQDDLEKVKEVFQDAQKSSSLNAECRLYNKEMTDIVNDYKTQVADWDNQAYTVENAFPSATQSLWYSHYLGKKRIKGLGLETRCLRMSPTTYPPAENQRFSIRYSHDGKNLICKILDRLWYQRTFYQNGRQIWQDGSGGKECEYYIIQSKSVSGKYICPNCGYEDSVENLIDGCDYCHTKFHMEDFDGKVSSVYMPNDNSRSRNSSQLKKFHPAIFIIAVLLIFPFTANFPLLRIPITFAAIVLFLFISLTKESRHSMAQGPARNKDSIAKLRKIDPLFSEEYFIGNLTNKLESIHYADSMEELGAFVYCDLSNTIAGYANVLGCKLMECVIMDYGTDDAFQMLNVNIVMELAEIAGSAVGKREEKLRLQLKKSRESKTNAVNDLIVYRCKSCGAGVSLLNGGKCAYCGSHMDMIKHDWVVTGYEIV